MRGELVVLRPEGLYCEAGGFYIDPWRPVDRAVITHAHADHARTGHRRYLAAEPAREVMHARLGRISLQTLQWGEAITQGDVRVSLFPAGHILGSAQVRIEHRGEVWVVSGDYKLEADPTCAAFEPVRCDTFITESTFGLPIYKWLPQAEVFRDINSWWEMNASEGVVSVMVAYSLGKAQRILQQLDQRIGPVFVHPAVDEMNNVVRTFTPGLPPAQRFTKGFNRKENSKALLIIPPASHEANWMEKLKPYSLAYASGWMNLRGARRWQAADRGFVLSDHADWPGLLKAIEGTGAEKVYVTHGYTATFVRWLKEQGKDAEELETLFEGDRMEMKK